MLVARNKREQNEAAIDPWTLVHVAAGLAAGLMDLPYAPALGAAVAYEVLEQKAESTGVGQAIFNTSGPESPANIAVDLVVFAAGMYAGKRWNRS